MVLCSHQNCGTTVWTIFRSGQNRNRMGRNIPTPPSSPHWWSSWHLPSPQDKLDVITLLGLHGLRGGFQQAPWAVAHVISVRARALGAGRVRVMFVKPATCGRDGIISVNEKKKEMCCCCKEKTSQMRKRETDMARVLVRRAKVFCRKNESKIQTPYEQCKRISWQSCN